MNGPIPDDTHRFPARIGENHPRTGSRNGRHVVRTTPADPRTTSRPGSGSVTRPWPERRGRQLRGPRSSGRPSRSTPSAGRRLDRPGARGARSSTASPRRTDRGPPPRCRHHRRGAELRAERVGRPSRTGPTLRGEATHGPRLPRCSSLLLPVRVSRCRSLARRRFPGGVLEAPTGRGLMHPAFVSGSMREPTGTT